MASADVATSDAEQQRRLMLAEQERRDYEYAQRIYHEQFNTPPGTPEPPIREQATSPASGRGQNRRNQQARNRTSATSTSASDGGGPIRRGANRGGRRGRGARGAAAGTNSTRENPVTTRRTARITTGGAAPSSRGRGRRGNAAANRSRPQANAVEVVELSSDDDSSDDEQIARPRGVLPAVSADYIHRLLENELMRDNARDFNYRPPVIDMDEDSDEEDEDEEEDDELDSDLDSDDDIILDEIGHLHAERNNIEQPIFDEDRQMYNRELDLYHDDDEYQVPPAEAPKQGRKAPEPDPTWGDCTMCSNTPVKPQGCRKCLQFLGCADCVRRWHGARQSSYERPNCPLCRAPWNGHTPGVCLMPTIEKHRKKLEEKKVSGQSSSSSSSRPSTSRSK